MNKLLARVAAGVLAMGAMLLGGCATYVVPPAAPPHPTAVYLCDYGVHSSLLLPTGHGRFVEYEYGDWDYAVLNETNFFYILQALFFSKQPALGRRYLTARPGETFPYPPNKPLDVQRAVVNGKRVAILVAQLNARYCKHLSTEYVNDEANYKYTFVKDQRHYDLLNDCNRLTAQNLSDLGCKIEGVPILSNFIVWSPSGKPHIEGPMKLGRPSPQAMVVH